MKKPCILRIISDILRHQALMAMMLAEPHIRDLGAQKLLRDEIKRNQSDFARLVPDFQIQIEPRQALPKAG